MSLCNSVSLRLRNLTRTLRLCNRAAECKGKKNRALSLCDYVQYRKPNLRPFGHWTGKATYLDRRLRMGRHILPVANELVRPVLDYTGLLPERQLLLVSRALGGNSDRCCGPLLAAHEHDASLRRRLRIRLTGYCQFGGLCCEFRPLRGPAY